MEFFLISLRFTKIHIIHKKGLDSLIENHRPIAILDAIEKVFEGSVHEVVSKFVKPLISTKQHAFQKGRSTVSNLLEHQLRLSNALENRSQVDVIYADMSKAFDLVDHSILLRKLRSFGIAGKLLQWFESYLTNRQMYVRFNGSTSLIFVPCSGVPQGSILGPLLFIIYINDLPTHIASSCSIFTDDVKISREITDIDDAKRLEADFKQLGQWCDSNGLVLNDGKCAIMTFTNKMYDVRYNYTCATNNDYLHRDTEFKDLGVTFDKKFRFAIHIDTIVKKALRSLGFVIRTCRKFQNISTIIYLYNTLVRIQLEYASCIWSPYYKEAIMIVERVQRRFTRYVFKKFRIPYLDYDGRLRVLGIDSLKFRRIINDGVLLCKVMNGGLVTTISNEICVRENRFNIRNMGFFRQRPTRSTTP